MPKIGYSNGTTPKKLVKSQNLILALQNSPLYIPGKNGSILSLGCFSECWDRINIQETKKLLYFAIGQGNPIQLSTKKYIHSTDFINIDKIKWFGQVTIFISSSTISYWDKFEKGTSYPFKRFKAFETLNQLGIPSFLYIKPVIPSITMLDINYYGRIMDLYKINSVVGSSFSTLFSNRPAPISRNKLFYKYYSDEEFIRNRLKNYGKIYHFSIEPVNELRLGNDK